MNKKNSTDIVSLSKIKAALEKEGSAYTTEQLLLIRDFLYNLAELEYEVYLSEKRRDLEFNKSDEQKLKEAA